MLIGIAHINRKRKNPGTCQVCRERIAVGEVHTVIITRYGKGQQAVFRLRAAQGKARTKKSGLQYSRLHLDDCTSIWFLGTYDKRSEARAKRKGGRPPLPNMSPEEMLVRRRLVRKRADYIRQILATDDNARINVLAERLLVTQDTLEVPVTPPDKKNIHRAMILSKVQNKINRARKVTREDG